MPSQRATAPAARLVRTSLLAASSLVLMAGCTFLVDWSSIHEDGAPTPAPDAGDAGSFCQNQVPTPTLCDSFDDDAVGAPWTLEKRGTGLIGLDDAFTVTPPHALFARCPSCVADRDWAYGSATIPGMPIRGIALGFDLRIEAREAGQIAGVASVQTLGDKGKAMLRLLLIENGGAVAEESFFPGNGPDGQYHALPLAKAPATGQWMRVEMRVDLGAPARATVKLDGEAVLEGVALQFPFSNDATRSVGTTGFTYVDVGVLYATGSWALRVDNLVHVRD